MGRPRTKRSGWGLVSGVEGGRPDGQDGLGATVMHGWLLLADVCDAPPCTPEQDLATKMPVLVGYVQHGIDV
ncbi:hypothetical protein SAMN02745121_02019 [Nannocystis exedens]|uniref:Uncharacterized protein n=1 Tax=Nannocystis exedens TaxID=54 RepID=A0A1I1VVR2_9BACT|nr:hypothetical protein NAEX_05987 [Nannocystis exedens]SFD87186.1 hypothetical protein SAMN02745121_02019 [Nannocystis exedens]